MSTATGAAVRRSSSVVAARVNLASSGSPGFSKSNVSSPFSRRFFGCASSSRSSAAPACGPWVRRAGALNLQWLGPAHAIFPPKPALTTHSKPATPPSSSSVAVDGGARSVATRALRRRLLREVEARAVVVERAGGEVAPAEPVVALVVARGVVVLGKLHAVARRKVEEAHPRGGS